MAKDWMSKYMNPSKGSFEKWLRGQTGQYKPLIGLLTDQRNAMSPESDFSVKAYRALLGAQPSREAITGGYQTAMADLAKYIQGVNTTQGAQGVSDIVGSVGAGLGVNPGAAADVAQAAGTLSGVGAAGGNVMSEAIMGGVQAQLKGQQLQALTDAASRSQQLALGLGEAEQSAKDKQRSIAQQIAELQGKQVAGRLNPLDIATAFMKFSKSQKALADYLKGSSGGGGGTGKTPQNPPNIPTGLTKAQLDKIQGSSANSYLEGLKAGYFG